MIANLIGAVFALAGALVLLFAFARRSILSGPDTGLRFVLGAVLLALGGVLLFFV